MARRDRGSVDSEPDSSDGALFFGSDDGFDDHDVVGPDRSAYGAPVPDSYDRPRPAPRPRSESAVGSSRLEKRRHARDHRRRRVVGILAVALVIVLGISVWFIGLPIYHYLYPQDYDGAGTGAVVVTVRANDSADDIGHTLQKKGVVASERAFTDAASNNSRAQNIQPGSYALHKHMSAKSALTLLLNPSSRLNSDTVVTEGATVVDVEKRLTAAACTGPTTKGTPCGLGLKPADVTTALTDVQALGIPTDYLPKGKQPASAEGFLFPATYTFDEGTTVTDALQQMVGRFTDEARTTQFTSKAKALGLTPYDALIIASIAQAEAKFPEDFAKVARVILNRLHAKQNLAVDATSAYAAKLKGLDPTKQIYAQTQGPFNTYKNAGLPPTPIGNPGQDAMTGAVAPAKGTWLFYVNKDAAGHLGFYSDEASFIKAVRVCAQHGWGCAAP